MCLLQRQATAQDIAIALADELGTQSRHIDIDLSGVCANVYPFDDNRTCFDLAALGDCERSWLDNTTMYCNEACERCGEGVCTDEYPPTFVDQGSTCAVQAGMGNCQYIDWPYCNDACGRCESTPTPEPTSTSTSTPTPTSTPTSTPTPMPTPTPTPEPTPTSTAVPTPTATSAIDMCYHWGYGWPDVSSDAVVFDDKTSVACALESEVCYAVTYEMATTNGDVVGVSKGGCMDTMVIADCNMYEIGVNGVLNVVDDSWGCTMCQADRCNDADLGAGKYVEPLPVDVMMLLDASSSIDASDWVALGTGVQTFLLTLRSEVPGWLQVGAMQWSSTDWKVDPNNGCIMWHLSPDVGGAMDAVADATQVSGGTHMALALSACGWEAATFGKAGSTKVCMTVTDGDFTDRYKVYDATDYAGVWDYCQQASISPCTVDDIAAELKDVKDITIISVVVGSHADMELAKMVASCNASQPASECHNIIPVSSMATFEVSATPTVTRTSILTSTRVKHTTRFRSHTPS